MLRNTTCESAAALASQGSADRTIFVIGNGPSLRGFDFGRLSGAETLGMNAAFRFWERIGWRPTHYACLDDALIDTHKDAILSLIEEGEIRSFCLSGRILDHFPELSGRPNIRFLDSYVPFWHAERGQKYGLELLDSPFFRTRFPDLLTTGAYSLRFAAELGYQRIALLGVDLDYVPLAEAEPVNGLRLVVTETPSENPNYFFDDYQQVGDEFHVPNPESHDEELHVAAFAAVRDDFEAEGLDISILNSNPASRLSREGILPFASLRSLLGEPTLGAVVVPLTASEHDQLLDNLWLWSQPAFTPFLGKRPGRVPDLVFVCNNEQAAAVEPAVRDYLESTPALRACFGDIRFLNLNLVGDADLYLRDNNGPAAAFGWRAGPNHLFFGALDVLRDHWGHALFMETDCVPLRPDWLGRINTVLTGDEMPWVLGSIYRGSDPLGPREKRHINGNAVYATGDPEFHKFVDTVWRPSLDRMVKDRPELAFDCVLEALYEQANALAGDNDELWAALRATSHRFRYTDAIVNLTSGRRGPHKLEHQVSGTVASSPTAAIVHSRMLAAYVSALRHSDCPRNLNAILDFMRAEPPDAVEPPLPEAIALAANAQAAAPWTFKRILRGGARRLLKLAGG
ncbi:MAG: hypothetical protein ACK4MQ_08495 [Hyphomonas sp.]